ncbi:MAG TPA: flagellar hook-basal body complex protein [Actinophytocola sp.]|uniref:flagellar hook-basal body complex protein n=1 Tax=Actinophytocola sp. TaxID=1872138 RepID=UPI002DB5F6AA|nr:flagellar hook-basal body complex protein [Actinophytocola sp.]HEU5474219.1 flagellar hook-basal body complex protein [Actinophytocola sp.]
MLRSLFSGISGLRGHQQMMDVTGNNIANVNTTGFKSSQVVFADALSQTLRGATAPGANTGATNPAQVGLGVRTAGINTNFGQGATQVTGRNEDMLIQGDGFFVVNAGGQQVYTRAGAMNFDATGQLVTPDGGLVQGWMAPNNPATDPLQPLVVDSALYRSFSVASDGTLTGLTAAGTSVAIGQIAIANFANPGGLEKAGGSLYRETVNSGAVQVGTAGQNGTGEVISNALEMSNVDLAQELTGLIIAQRGFQANSKVISTSDELLQDLMNLKR